jgi:hypothetical protein
MATKGKKTISRPTRPDPTVALHNWAMNKMNPWTKQSEKWMAWVDSVLRPQHPDDRTPPKPPPPPDGNYPLKPSRPDPTVLHNWAMNKMNPWVKQAEAWMAWVDSVVRPKDPGARTPPKPPPPPDGNYPLKPSAARGKAR